MMHKFCMPGADPTNNEGDRRENAYEIIQRNFFTRYGKVHGNKTQGLLPPNGMIGRAWYHSVAQNDLGLIKLSWSEEYLVGILHPQYIG